MKRGSDRLGLPFGNIYDPIGKPIERAFSLYSWIVKQDKAGDYVAAYMTGVYGTGVDTSTNDGLRHIVESIGLSWQKAQEHLRHDNRWQELLNTNREELSYTGL
jgi:2-hydroxychromene-2-carboxylate isomerase